MIIADPGGVLQLDADKWGILYNPRTDASFAVNPMSIFIWNLLKDRLTLKEIRAKVDAGFSGVPESVDDDILKFIAKLAEIDLVKVENP